MMVILYLQVGWHALIAAPYDKPQAEQQFQFGRIYQPGSRRVQIGPKPSALFRLPEYSLRQSARGARQSLADTGRTTQVVPMPDRLPRHQEFHAPSHAEAIRWATVLGQLPEFAVCEIRDNMVLRHTPHWQDYAHMADREFQASKSRRARCAGQHPGRAGRRPEAGGGTGGLSNRAHISLREKLAAALAWYEGIPYEDAQKMSAEQCISLFQFDHWPHRKRDGGSDHFSNLRPMLIGEHRKKTAEVDLPAIAKDRRIESKWNAFMTSISTGQKPPKRQSRWRR